MRCSCALLAPLCLLAPLSEEARAGPPEPRPPTPAARLEVGLGYVWSRGSDFEGALTLEARAMRSRSLLLYGVAGELGTGVFTNHRAGLGLLGGLGRAVGQDSIELLGEVGVHGYWQVVSRSTGLLDRTSGGSAAIPYVGLRLGPAVTLLRRGQRAHGFLVSLSARWEPWSRTVEYRSLPLLSALEVTRSRQARLGDAFELGVSLVGAIDWDAL